MKTKILLAVIMLSAATTMMSCKKDYVCKCSKTYTTGNGTSTTNYSQYTYKEDRKRAEDRCNDNTRSGSDIYGNYSINCQIQ